MDTPYWLVDSYSTAQTPAVVPDDLTGQMLAVEYLIEQGHTRIAHVGLATELEAEAALRRFSTGDATA